jgi:NADH:ubiquinone oxidoreductase subunit 5 (subunit L)/multisubunit Na+/H+ antiporter MnhA subunit
MIWWMILFPLMGAFINGLVLRKASKGVSQAVAVAAMVASFVCALMTFTNFMAAGGQATVIKGFP